MKLGEEGIGRNGEEIEVNWVDLIKIYTSMNTKSKYFKSIERLKRWFIS